MTENALVGYTGFVGSNLLRAGHYDYLYRSTNFLEAQGRSFRTLVFSGAKAEKWKANLDPAADRKHVDELISVLSRIKADKAVLISTVDVYPKPNNEIERWIDESEVNHAYGKNRALLEREFVRFFPKSIVLRLPALFGPGLKKNVVFDFLNDNQTGKIDSRGVFQFYDLKWLQKDIDKAWLLQEKTGKQLFNISTEPVSVAEVAMMVLGKEFHNEVVETPATYNIKSGWAKEWSGTNGYLYKKEDVLLSLKNFAQEYRSGQVQ